MSFGIYIHIPYCIQRCTYCDFATYEQSKLMPHTDYTSLLLKEISQRASWFLNGCTSRSVDTIFFGGGTPSLFSIDHIVLLLDGLSRAGYTISKNAEMTIEINPATVDEKKLLQYLDLGFNRFSIGAQSFHDHHLKKVHREHSVQDTLDTLQLMRSTGVNYNFDLLFGIPNQTIDELKFDLEHVFKWMPSHLSPYYLTVPEGHPLSKNRPPEDDQMAMFDLIYNSLPKNGYVHYEISNFALPGFESKHNSLYWSDQEFWGIGMSSHSYLKHNTPWGARFWNPNNIKIYQKQIETSGILVGFENLESHYFEILKKNQSLTDFCHTSLRRQEGIIEHDVKKKFATNGWDLLYPILSNLVKTELVSQTPTGYSLTQKGRLLSNQVFEKLTFLEPIPD